MSEAQESAVAGTAPAATPIAATLRSAAARAAEAIQGLALVFAHAPQGEPGLGAPPLRAAAGFDTPEEARAAAQRVKPWVQDACESGREIALPRDAAALGSRIESSVALPLVVDGRVRGVLVTGAASAPSPEAREALGAIAESAAVRLDHAALLGRVRALEEELTEKALREEERGDEVLKLSEALFAQDIELLRNNEKLGKVERLKNDFIEKMSRELRTPLNSIIEAIISVLAGENEHLSEEAKASLRAALDDGTSFLRTLQNILDLWRIKQGELPVEQQEVNFREVVEEAIFSVQDTLGDKAVTIERRYHEPLPKVRTDLAKVNQVLFLLLDNAAKFTREGRIEIEAAVKEGRLVCHVRDTGIGICPDDQQFLFDEFFQVDDAASTRYRGAGLGLTLVRDLLVLLDGEIEISSEVGVGTCVTFHVPVVTIG
jgi:signal transduction histidine kinase